MRGRTRHRKPPARIDLAMKLLTLAIAVASLGFASPTFAQQSDPRKVVPPTPQKPSVSPTLTVVEPSTVQTPSANPIAVTPQALSAPQPSKPGVSQPAPVETNTVQAPNLNQPLPISSVQSSLWDKSNATPASAWEATTNALAPAVKASSDPWKSSSPSQNWDTSPLLGSSGTRTEWK